MTGGSPSKLIARQYGTYGMTITATSSPCRMGSAKAAVLPLPVSASPMRSLPCRAKGIASLCIGVGA